ncbi:MAG: metalloregulator ArsR/SmtB family transcription factor [Motiliproteus sp.]|nr:metalloregulator ArsR/SmtB family transcription factor [Motiliproteus sp.]
MVINPVLFFKCLADDTRLRTLLLIVNEEELCVCELASALDLSQPKISRHLAQLRQTGLLQDRRQGQWIYYRINPQLDDWCRQVLHATAKAQSELVANDRQRLLSMGDRPQRQAVCC